MKKYQSNQKGGKRTARLPQGTSKPKAAKPSVLTTADKARMAVKPSINGAAVIQAYQGNVMGKDADMSVLIDQLRETFTAVKGGDLHTLEAMLVSQATALQTIFTSLARRATTQERLPQYQAFLGLSLKAQAQSRATISALVDLKYPRQATFVKQANIANGPQQVHTGGLLALILSNTRRRARRRKKSHPSKTNYWRQTMGNPAKGWTPERRKRQSEAVTRWKPWQQFTGPESPGGRAVVARNAWRGGHWLKLRQAVRDLNGVIQEQRNSITLVNNYFNVSNHTGMI